VGLERVESADWLVEGNRMRSRSETVRIPAVAALLLCAALLGGCQSPLELLALGRPTPSASLPHEIAEAIEARKRFGLRADEEWVRQLAADPAAQKRREMYGFPATLAELAEIEARGRALPEVFAAVEEYGEGRPLEFGGVFLDTPGSADIVALFTSHVDEHEATLRALVGPTEYLQVEPARWTLQALNQLRDRIRQDERWFDAAGAELEWVDVSVERNVVAVQIRTRDRGLPAAVVEHFGAPGMIAVHIKGVPMRNFPRGTLRGLVVNQFGRQIQNNALDIEPVSLEPGVPFESGVGFAVTDEGRFQVLGMPAVAYEIRVKRAAHDGEWQLVASVKVTVRPNAVTFVQIVVPE
jgi:hypothetical protein